MMILSKVMSSATNDQKWSRSLRLVLRFEQTGSPQRFAFCAVEVIGDDDGDDDGLF